MSLREDQKQELVSIFKVEPRSIQDIASVIGVHYVTAQRWIKELEDLELIRRMPFLRGKEKVYCLTAKADESGALVIQVGDKMRQVAELAVASQGVDPYSYFKSLLAYLYRRSLNWDSDRYKGVWTPVDIRDEMRQARTALMQQLQVVEQILLLEDVFDEGQSAHEAMGRHPDLGNIDMHAALVDNEFKRRHTSG